MSVLIIDADDTLWENNIYFEHAFDNFVEYLAHSSLTHAQVRDVLNEIELVNSKIHGYGSINFGRNLQQAYQHLAEREIRPDNLVHVMSLALFTKGHPDEQRMKVDRSGLSRHFSHTAIVKEKDSLAYLNLIGEQGFDPASSWMIGNSPKSDINPALEAGLGAVLVPHARTWILEHQDLRTPTGGRFLQVERFADLRKHF